MKKLVPINAVGGVSKTIVSGCYKFGTATLLFWDGSTGTAIMEIDVYEDSDKSTKEIDKNDKRRKI